MVYVRDMVIGNKYTVNGVSLKLSSKEIILNSKHDTDPNFKLTFISDDGVEKTESKGWDEDYVEVKKGGKKSKMRKARKSRKIRRKKSIRSRKNCF